MTDEIESALMFVSRVQTGSLEYIVDQLRARDEKIRLSTARACAEECDLVAREAIARRGSTNPAESDDYLRGRNSAAASLGIGIRTRFGVKP